MPLPLESTDAVVVFLKVPTLHKTKTRLIPRFGAEGAYAIAQALAEDTLRRLGSSPLLDDARRVACFAPADGADRLEQLAAALVVPLAAEGAQAGPESAAATGGALCTQQRVKGRVMQLVLTGCLRHAALLPTRKERLAAARQAR